MVRSGRQTVKQTLYDRTEVSGHKLVASGIRMNTVIEKVGSISCHSFQQERYKGNLILLSQLDIGIVKIPCELGPIVGRQPHTDEKRRNARLLGNLNNSRQVALHRRKGAAAQRIIRTDAQNEKRRIMLPQKLSYPGQPPGAGIPTDTSVDDPRLQPRMFQHLTQAGGPRQVQGKAISRRQAVAERDYHLTG